MRAKRERDELEPRESSCFLERDIVETPKRSIDNSDYQVVKKPNVFSLFFQFFFFTMLRPCLVCVLVMNTVSKIIIIIINIFPARHSTNLHVAISQACPCTTLTSRPLSH